MRHASPRPLAALAVIALASSAAAQNFGPQPGYQPGPYQPAPFQQPGPFQPNPYQLGAAPPAGQSSSGPSIVGTWSGTATGTSGQTQISEAFSPDGTFVSVGRLVNGFVARVWGTYRFSPAGPGQFRLETQLAGWLPRETCQQTAENPPQCQPMQLPTTGVSLVTFPSPTQLQSTSQTEAGSYSVEQRDSQPVLLQVQAPQRWINIIQPAPAPAPSYAPGPVTVGRPYSPMPTPSRNPCPNDDIQTNICKYSGRLVTSGGCLRCVGG